MKNLDRYRTLTDAAQRTLGTLSQHAPQLLRRADIDTGRDGYPTRASGAEPTITAWQPPEPRLQLDQWGRYEWSCRRCPDRNVAATEADARRAFAEHWHRAEHGTDDRSIDYSDPTGDTATNNADTRPRDPLTSAARRLNPHLENALRHLDAALSIARTGPDTPAEPDLWCTNHLTANLHEPRAARPGGTRRYATLCRFCGEFQAEHGLVPPAELLRLRADKGRIYDADVDRILGGARRGAA